MNKFTKLICFSALGLFLGSAPTAFGNNGQGFCPTLIQLQSVKFDKNDVYPQGQIKHRYSWAVMSKQFQYDHHFWNFGTFVITNTKDPTAAYNEAETILADFVTAREVQGMQDGYYECMFLESSSSGIIAQTPPGAHLLNPVTD